MATFSAPHVSDKARGTVFGSHVVFGPSCKEEFLREGDVGHRRKRYVPTEMLSSVSLQCERGWYEHVVVSRHSPPFIAYPFTSLPFTQNSSASRLLPDQCLECHLACRSKYADLSSGGGGPTCKRRLASFRALRQVVWRLRDALNRLRKQDFLAGSTGKSGWETRWALVW